MEPFNRVTGVAAPMMAANIDTDVIMPKQFLKGIDRNNLDRGVFFDRRFLADGSLNPDFILNQPAWQGVSFLIVGPNFGCGSSREHAVWGLRQLGIRALIGTTRQLSANRRVLCASPDYLAKHGAPLQIADLRSHQCLVIQERSSQFGAWPLTNGVETQQIHVSSQLSSNNGSVVLNWALKGHGIILRSQWEVQRYIAHGELVQIFPEWYQAANIWAVYSNRTSGSAKLKVCIDFLVDYFQQYPPVEAN